EKSEVSVEEKNITEQENIEFNLENETNKNINGEKDELEILEYYKNGKELSILYQAQVKKGNYSVDSKPWGENGFEKVDTTSNFVNRVVDILEESSNNAYALIAIENKVVG